MTFLLLISSTLYLVCGIFTRFQGAFKNEKKQLLFVLSVFSVSYSYRLVFNFIQSINPSLLSDLQHRSMTAYSLLIFFLFFVGEVLPLTLIFHLQYRNHRLLQKQKRHQPNSQSNQSPAVKGALLSSFQEYKPAEPDAHIQSNIISRSGVRGVPSSAPERSQALLAGAVASEPPSSSSLNKDGTHSEDSSIRSINPYEAENRYD